jgi:hypothetical protein
MSAATLSVVTLIVAMTHPIYSHPVASNLAVGAKKSSGLFVVLGWISCHFCRFVQRQERL